MVSFGCRIRPLALGIKTDCDSDSPDCARAARMQSLTPTPRRVLPMTVSPGRVAIASSTVAMRARCAEVVLRDAGAGAPDVDEVGIARQTGGALQIADHQRRERAVVGVDERRGEACRR